MKKDFEVQGAGTFSTTDYIKPYVKEDFGVKGAGTFSTNDYIDVVQIKQPRFAELK